MWQRRMFDKVQIVLDTKKNLVFSFLFTCKLTFSDSVDTNENYRNSIQRIENV